MQCMIFTQFVKYLYIVMSLNYNLHVSAELLLLTLKIKKTSASTMDYD